ncbi:LuxR C-terminal-related transcriptional regulator [Pseudaestuariivita rosea]|uniref:LuxR C-terminal-related transcriptional regulator n=1 Tax=Pseudaestuariivita rosea TaxID=2763263 RepID=UPI001ABB83BA|nr:LuxR C-terminal-related transcriptional regulator [Pseudaestuariivita rosea]
MPDRAVTSDIKPQIIDQIYDVAVDPARLEILLDSWEDFIAPYRNDDMAPVPFDDTSVALHFKRAEIFLDRLEDAGSNPHDVVLSQFDKVAAFTIDATLKVVALNDAAAYSLELMPGGALSTLPLYADDIQLLENELRKTFRSEQTDTRMFRFRSTARDRFIVFQLKAYLSDPDQPFVAIITSEVGWPNGFSDTLKAAFGLSTAEAEVLRAIVECKSLRQIAEERGRSTETIRAQVRSILSKTETHSQAELVRVALTLMDVVTASGGAGPVTTGAEESQTSMPPVPVHMMVREDGRKLTYLILGHPTGRPVLYLPSDVALTRWPRQAEAELNRRRIKVIVPIRGGFGQSDPYQTGRNALINSIVDDCLALLDQEKVKSCPVIAMLDDSLYAFELAARAPDRITGILSAGGMLPLTKSEQFARMHKWHRFIMGNAKYAPHLLPFMAKAIFYMAKRIGKRSLMKALYGNCPGDIDTYERPEVFEALIEGTKFAASEGISAHDAFAAEAIVRASHDWSDSLTRIAGTIPVQFMNGLQSPMFPKETVREFQVDYPWIDFKLYDDVGDLVFFRHWDDVLKLLEKRFL